MFENSKKYYEAIDGDVDSLGSETIYQPGIYTEGDNVGGNRSLITLTTTPGYLNGLKEGVFGIISLFYLYPDFRGAGRVYDSQTTLAGSEGIVFKKNGGAPTFYSKWEDDGGSSLYFGVEIVTLDEFHLSTTVVNPLTTGPGSGWGCMYIDDKFFDEDNSCSLLKDTEDNIKLGAKWENDTYNAHARFGFFSFLDLSGISAIQTNDLTGKRPWVASFSKFLYDVARNYNYDPSRIRKAIYTFNKNIEGVFWKLDEAGLSGSASSISLSACDIKTGKNKSGFGGYTSVPGCSGVIL